MMAVWLCRLVMPLSARICWCAGYWSIEMAIGPTDRW